MGNKFAKKTFQTKNGAVLELYDTRNGMDIYIIKKIKTKDGLTLYFKPFFNKDQTVKIGMFAVFHGRNFHEINPVWTLTNDDEENKQLRKASDKNKELLTELLSGDKIIT